MTMTEKAGPTLLEAQLGSEIQSYLSKKRELASLRAQKDLIALNERVITEAQKEIVESPGTAELVAKLKKMLASPHVSRGVSEPEKEAA